MLVVLLRCWFGTLSVLCFLAAGLAGFVAASSAGEFIGHFLILSSLAGAACLAANRTHLEPALWAGVILVQAIIWLILECTLLDQSLPIASLVATVLFAGAFLLAFKVQGRLVAQRAEEQEREKLEAASGRKRIGARAQRRVTVRPGWAAPSAVALVGIAALALPMTASQMPPTLEEVAESFEESWASGGSAALGSWFVASNGSRVQRQFRQAIAKRDWDEASLPQLGSLTLPEPTDIGDWTRWEMADGQLEALWRLTPDGWRIARLKFPEIQAPPVREAVLKLQRAWNASDIEALASLYRPGRRTEAPARIRRYFERKGWAEGTPQLLDMSVLSEGNGTARVQHTSADGDEYSSRWSFEQGSWCIRTLPN